MYTQTSVLSFGYPNEQGELHRSETPAASYFNDSFLFHATPWQTLEAIRGRLPTSNSLVGRDPYRYHTVDGDGRHNLGHPGGHAVPLDS